MNIQLSNNLNKKFITVTVPKLIKQLTLSSFKQSHAHKLDEYIKKELKLDTTVRHCLYIAVSNVIITKNSDGTISVGVNPSINVPGYPIKLTSILKLINYGNLDVKGYPILNRVLKYIESNQVQLEKAFTLRRRR
jgi:hypothetical protein